MSMILGGEDRAKTVGDERTKGRTKENKLNSKSSGVETHSMSCHGESAKPM